MAIFLIFRDNFPIIYEIQINLISSSDRKYAQLATMRCLCNLHRSNASSIIPQIILLLGGNETKIYIALLIASLKQIHHPNDRLSH